MRTFAEALEDLPTLEEGHMDDLKIDTGKIRIWLSRVDGSIAIEELIKGSWDLVKEHD